MKKVLMAAVLLSLLPLSAPAAAPTEASLEQLMEVTRVREFMASMQAPIEQNIRASAALALKGKSLTAAQQQELEGALQKIATIVRSEISYEKLKPTYLKIYRESLDQAEVDGMIAFYQTPAGQAVILKMPVITQKSMGAVQEMLGSLMPRLEAALKETAESRQVMKHASPDVSGEGGQLVEAGGIEPPSASPTFQTLRT